MSDTLVLQKSEWENTIVLAVSTKDIYDRRRLFWDDHDDNTFRIRYRESEARITCRCAEFVLCVIPGSTYWDNICLQSWGHVSYELFHFNTKHGLVCAYAHPRTKILEALSFQSPVCRVDYGYKCIQLLREMGSGSFALVDRGRIAYVDGIFVSRIDGSKWKEGADIYLLKTTTRMLLRMMPEAEKNRVMRMAPERIPKGIAFHGESYDHTVEPTSISHSLKEVLDHYMEWFVNKDPIY